MGIGMRVGNHLHRSGIDFPWELITTDESDRAESITFCTDRVFSMHSWRLACKEKKQPAPRLNEQLLCRLCTATCRNDQ